MKSIKSFVLNLSASIQIHRPSPNNIHFTIIILNLLLIHIIKEFFQKFHDNKYNHSAKRNKDAFFLNIPDQVYF